MKSKLFLFICLVQFFILPIEANSKIFAGKVYLFTGAALAINSPDSRNLYQNSRIYVGDIIHTSKNTRMHLIMKDGTNIILGDETEFKIEHYDFQFAQKMGSGYLRLIKGVFKITSGKLSELQGEPLIIETPHATVGVKGKHVTFWGGSLKEDIFEILLLKEKSIHITNRVGTVEINKIGYGVAVTSKDAAPSNLIEWGETKLQQAVATIDWIKKP